MRKRLLVLTILSALVAVTATAQDNGHYTISGGILGGANYSRLRVGDNNSNLGTKWRWGGVGGIFVGFPIGNSITFQPEVLYSQMGGKVSTPGSPTLDFEQKSTYISIPLLFKFQIAKPIAIVAGPQFDVLVKAKYEANGTSTDNQSNLQGNDFAVTGGIELFPRSRLSLMLRYIHGFTSVLPPGPPQYYNQAFQGTLHLRLFGGKHIVPPPPPPPPPPAPLDSDGDGINDDVDKCPNVAGVAKYNGCPIPDTDKDGINDDEDKCPNEPGTAKYNGCPVPDTDKDGINDDDDKCPTVPGTARYNGCPVPDTDGDGINDEEDKCPTIAGVAENGGCPAIPKFNASDIQFITGSSTLTTKALKELGDMIDYLKQYDAIKLQVNGYTDNVGKPEFNQKLSLKRADAVKAALVKKGISADRISTSGFGVEQPVADNKTAAGRAKNRRVEFKFAQ